MTWMGEVHQPPVKLPPEEEQQDEEPENQETMAPVEDDSMPEAGSESVTQPLNAVAGEPVSPEQKVDVQPPAVIAEPAQSMTWLKAEDVAALKSRWNAIQIEFVDEPHKSVEQADALVGDVLKMIEQSFAETRATLEDRWVNHEQVSTEDLRTTLQSYRSFFNHFLAS